MKEIQVSVIIPTYNRASVLERSVMSVLSQTVSDIELIVVDDCSTDNSKELIDHIDDDRLIYIRQASNMGACAARNRGIQAARGKFIAFQDSDDIWLPDKLEKILAQFDETRMDVFFHRLRRHYPNREKTTLFPTLDQSQYISHEAICAYAMISTQTILAKREVFAEHVFDPKVKKSQDYDWAIRASGNYRFYYSSEVLVEQYYQNDSISRQGIKTIKEMRQYFLDKYPDEVKRNPQFELYQLLIIAKNKTLLGENASSEYKRVYEIRHRKTDLVKYCLCKAHLLALVYRIKGAFHENLPGN